MTTSNPSLRLTPHAAAIAQYAELLSLTPEQFLNAFLAKFLLTRFADPQIGAAEPFLGSFTFNDRETSRAPGREDQGTAQ